MFKNDDQSEPDILTPRLLENIIYNEGNLEDFEEWDGGDFGGRIYPINFRAIIKFW